MPGIRGNNKISSRETLPRRFWAKVVKTRGCWIWIGSRSRGYGNIKVYENRRHISLVAHRLSYEMNVGPIPKGLTLDHLCRNPSCVNPRHLEPVPYRTNTLRGVGITAMNAKKTRCIRGHKFDKVFANGWRRCQACANEAQRRYYARKKKSLERP